MQMLRFGWLGLGVFLVTLVGSAQFQPPPAAVPTDEERQAIENRVRDLEGKIGVLRRQGIRDPALAELEVYPRAVRMVVRHGEFLNKNYPAWINEILDRGSLRVRQASRGEFPWQHQTGQPVVRAYRSRVDGSVQPYAVTLPHGYLKAPPRQWRLDVVLHGRNASLTEVSFLKSFDGSKPAPKEQDHVQIDVFGRGNNAYRWAGETDVFEALDTFLATERALGRGGLIDLSKLVLRGFSMGGAGAWHIGLHHPDQWCVIGPGAGFTTTRGYVKDLPQELPPYIEKALHIYDAVDYAENAADVPVVAYAGTADPQLKAAQGIEERLKGLGIPMKLVTAPDVGHKVPPEYAKKLEAEYAAAAQKGRSGHPKKVRFVTWTLKYDRCDWVQILGLEKHYEKALVEAETVDSGFKVKAENVRALCLRMPPGSTRSEIVVEIGDTKLPVKPATMPGTAGDLAVYLEKRDGQWVSVLPEYLATNQVRQPQKVRGQTGPIDDAFADSFLCVRGTGKAWNPATQTYADADLQRFTREWSKYMRGELLIKDDVDVTPEDLAMHHLILFGDPGSNALIAQVLPGLPLKWKKDVIELAGQRFSSEDHVPVLIYPSPLSSRYVVLNSGHTFHEADFKGTNALLYPRLGDYAVLKRTPTPDNPLAIQVATAGMFDEFWKVR